MTTVSPSHEGFVRAALVVILITRKVTVQQQESLYRGSEHRHANFVEHLHTILNVSATILHKVSDALSCAFNCLENARCISYNVAVFSDADDKYECQLLATDKYNSSGNMKPSNEFNHYSILVRHILIAIFLKL